MKNILVAALVALLFASCKKEVAELPPATQTGAHTFGAKVNGINWIPRGFLSIPAHDALQVQILANSDMTIRAMDLAGSPTEYEFEILLKNMTGPGTYQLNTSVTYPTTNANFAYYVKRTLTPVDEWITSATHTGTVIITKFDVPNKIVSGTFQFTLVDIYNPSRTLTVTDGRFDIKMP
ncbi:MAG: DUF6252 family protein [Chitinophagaceae bacterium]